MSSAISKLKPRPLDTQAENAWGIADMAAHFDITPRTIRFYEEQGLLSPARMGGRRVFSKFDRVRLSQILRAKRIGFSLDDIREFLEVADGQVDTNAELVRRKAGFEAVTKRLRAKRKDIDVVIRDMQDLCGVIDRHIRQRPDETMFAFAEAYQARLSAHMDDDFYPQ